MDEATKAFKKIMDEAAKQAAVDRDAKIVRDRTNPFGKPGWNLTRQGQVFKDNFTEACALAGEAGVVLDPFGWTLPAPQPIPPERDPSMYHTAYSDPLPDLPPNYFPALVVETPDQRPIKPRHNKRA